MFKNICTKTFKGLINTQKRNLNIHEYCAKQLFTKYGIPHQRGYVVTDTKEAANVAKKVQNDFNTQNLIVKSQVLAGGRGKGVFNTGFQGGVKFAKDVDKAVEYTNAMLGNFLITKQTTKEGVKVRKVFIAECLDFNAEMYFAIILDRASRSPVIIASKEGGMDIEEVAEKKPEAIVKEVIDVSTGPTREQLVNVAQKLGFEGESVEQAASVFEKLYKLLVETDATQIEINPLVKTLDGNVSCVDAKINFDDNGLYRQQEIANMRDIFEEDPREVEASKFDLNYVGLDGNIGCMVNGAGLAMATMDIIKLNGGEPANFLDVGGGATTDQVREAFKILTADPKVKAILVNIFGGIMRCDIIAEGIVQAAKTVNLQIPLFVRLEGTNVKQGLEILKNSGIKIISCTDLGDAGKKVGEFVKTL